MRSVGAPDMAFVLIPHPLGGIKLDEIRAKTTAVFPDIMKQATKWKANTANVAEQKKPYPAERFTFKGTGSDVTDLFYKQKWSDGLPIVPPTPERVKKMLAGTSMKPGEVIGIIPPRMGVITVELAAVHAVMAGAKPEYFPVILAAVEAILDPRHDWRSATTTTNPCAPLIVVNGPIVKEIGIQYGTGAFGPGPAASPNATIGRALNLIMDIVGGSQPPSPDKTTLGTPASYTMVLGENEDANPWATLSEQMGAKKGTSTVTVFEVRSYVNFNLHEPNTAEGLLHPMAKTIAPVVGLAENGFDCKEGVKELLILSPEHADTIKKDGWDLARVQSYLHENARISMADFNIRNNGRKPGCRENETNPTVVRGPGNYLIMVAGGEGKHSVFLETTRYDPVTKEIKK
ncbi:MAG TPA: hypothetical protein PLF54_10125 [Deltaproteobacteria bacterium]|jgi:hypothetical protein|nr:hypothetical protein [Deltaproteobacteria bacterium]